MVMVSFRSVVYGHSVVDTEAISDVGDVPHDDDGDYDYGNEAIINCRIYN